MESINTNPFVTYLNGLHNYYAQNSNAYGEKNLDNEFYSKTSVEINTHNCILDALNSEEPHILILTGHAGDGKTTLMYHVLSKLDLQFNSKAPSFEVVLPSGKSCFCIKDFSELSDDLKLEEMREIVNYPMNGKFVFMVANTGPLINTFGKLFDSAESENAKMELIDVMASNDGNLKKIRSYPMRVINVAGIDNTNFPHRFLEKVIDQNLWSSCSNCQKRKFCHIFLNRKLIVNNKTKVFDFLEKYYVWVTEYGQRLTIRSMTEHLAYMLTAGDECKDISDDGFFYKKLFANTFFGYVGRLPNPMARSLLAVRVAQDLRLEFKRIRADEKLIIEKSYSDLFSDEVSEIIVNLEKDIKNQNGWIGLLHRMFFFLNINTDNSEMKDYEDIFSKQFVEYFCLRKHIKKKPYSFQLNLIKDALRMIYLGTIVNNDSSTIPVTLSKDSGFAQNVQLVVGDLNANDFDLKSVQDSKLNENKYNLILCINDVEIEISLPLIDYFNELRNGVISTVIDPQLSRGIENLKAKLAKAVKRDKNDIRIVSINENVNNFRRIVIENDCIQFY